jgi:hypothetical protein
MARNLTEKQQLFLDVLFEEAGGNLVKAKKLAGYADAVTSRQVAEPLAEERLQHLLKSLLLRLQQKLHIQCLKL